MHTPTIGMNRRSRPGELLAEIRTTGKAMSPAASAAAKTQKTDGQRERHERSHGRAPSRLRIARAVNRR
jgi:hypothetical protein